MEDNFLEYLKKLGKNIAKIRADKGMTQYKLAKELIMEQSNLGRIESGKTNPTIKTLYKISEKLDCNITDLIDVNMIEL